MGSTVHVTDGRISGGKVGSIICGIMIAVLFNCAVYKGWTGYDFFNEILNRIIFTILSIGSIPFAVIAQKITSYVYDMITGGDSIHFEQSLVDLLARKFAGALVGALIFNCGIWFGFVYLNINKTSTQKEQVSTIATEAKVVTTPTITKQEEKPSVAEVVAAPAVNTATDYSSALQTHFSKGTLGANEKVRPIEMFFQSVSKNGNSYSIKGKSKTKAAEDIFSGNLSISSERVGGGSCNDGEKEIQGTYDLNENESKTSGHFVGDFTACENNGKLSKANFVGNWVKHSNGNKTPCEFEL